MDWLTDMTGRIAAATGIAADRLALDDAAAELLLDLAGRAAHASGARTNAPLLCHVLGRAVAHGASLDECARVVRAATGED
jgi:hypothetical protein